MTKTSGQKKNENEKFFVFPRKHFIDQLVDHDERRDASMKSARFSTGRAQIGLPSATTLLSKGIYSQGLFLTSKRWVTELLSPNLMRSWHRCGCIVTTLKPSASKAVVDLVVGVLGVHHSTESPWSRFTLVFNGDCSLPRGSYRSWPSPSWLVVEKHSSHSAVAQAEYGSCRKSSTVARGLFPW